MARTRTQTTAHQGPPSPASALEQSLDTAQKRQRASDTHPENTLGDPATDPIAFWAKEGPWPDKQHWARSNSATSATPSDQSPWEEKSAPFMVKPKLDTAGESKTLCRSLLEKQQSIPGGSLFQDDIFESTCQKIHDKNEERVMQDISRLISVNERWNNSIPFTSTRPQPDYCVGFRREAFTDKQLTKLSPFVGDFISGGRSFFMTTYYLYFPFLTREVKCGAVALDIADRQNAHSMTLAVRAIVELFRIVKREDEVNRQILAFSISHDHRSVRIYGHYPVIAGKDNKYYRHPIREFSFTELDGKDKWTAYRFTRNVYDMWMPAHFKNICSAIDQLPSSLDFNVPPPLSEATGPSQDLGNLIQSDARSVSVPFGQDNHSSNAEQPGAAPNTSFTGLEAVKRRKG
ncbi:hypothetical protein B0H67DRAFT_603500 [Lasiosphaeris hirsuta]|uniref:DUF7924 domain-containing protein n=1 Tax=Lasiosphaeris hirsuta TaxID=260670 RepID=A0AA40A3H4_9PEZI|nr:hypothetical protein B0H67DRAFT_603500 [Lasiosphaeris hirsuta]